MSAPRERRCDPEAIFELADGVSSSRCARETLAHLDVCPACREVYEREVELGAFLRTADLSEPRARSVCALVAIALPTRPLKARLLWASLALVLLLLAFVALSLEGTNPLVFGSNALGTFWGVLAGLTDLVRTMLVAAAPILLLALVVGALLDLCLASVVLWTTRRRSREA